MAPQLLRCRTSTVAWPLPLRSPVAGVQAVICATKPSVAARGPINAAGCPRHVSDLDAASRRRSCDTASGIGTDAARADGARVNVGRIVAADFLKSLDRQVVGPSARYEWADGACAGLRGSVDAPVRLCGIVMAATPDAAVTVSVHVGERGVNGDADRWQTPRLGDVFIDRGNESLSLDRLSDLPRFLWFRRRIGRSVRSAWRRKTSAVPLRIHWHTRRSPVPSRSRTREKSDPRARVRRGVPISRTRLRVRGEASWPLAEIAEGLRGMAGRRKRDCQHRGRVEPPQPVSPSRREWPTDIETAQRRRGDPPPHGRFAERRAQYIFTGAAFSRGHHARSRSR